jgi:ferrous iron transport protein B
MRRRLLEMGLLPSTQIALVRRAPLGDPIELELRGYRLSIRAEEASQVDILRSPVAIERHSRREFMPFLPKPSGPATQRIQLIGNPNSGKTTLFNFLAGHRARVGNFPGVTVTRRSGVFHQGSDAYTVVDYPGTYSLHARSPDERLVAAEVLKEEAVPPLWVAVIDGNALSRGLYLVLELLEAEQSVVVAVNMMDEVRDRGLSVDTERLASALGVPVVACALRNREGLDALKQAITEAAQCPRRAEPVPYLPTDAEKALEKLGADSGKPRADILFGILKDPEESSIASTASGHVRPSLGPVSIFPEGTDGVLTIVAARYGLVDGIATAVQGMSETASDRAGTRSQDRWDRLLTHPVFGTIAFLMVMGLVFQTLFAGAEPLMGLIETVLSFAQDSARAVLPVGLVQDFVVDGVLGGVGNVVVFVPQLFLLFFFIGLLEDVGYLARAAFLVDRLMKSVGLHGRAFVPFLSGYACAVPAISATRTLESRRDRLLCMMVIPLASCSARLPVYTLVAAVVFAGGGFAWVSYASLAILGMYFLSLACSFLSAWVLGRTVLRGSRLPLVLELPPYRSPLLVPLVRTAWDKVMSFLRDAGTIILAMSVAMWALMSFPRDSALERELQVQRQRIVETSADTSSPNESLLQLDGRIAEARLTESYGGQLGKAIEPVFAPLGFDWRLSVAVVGSFVAREVFVSTLGVIFGVLEADESDAGLRSQLAGARTVDGRLLMTPLVGITVMVFFLLSCQCMSTLAAVYRESRSIGWPVFLFVYMSTFAYLVSLLVYQGGRVFFGA